MAITRSPRGFGSIIKMGGNRRNPYMVRIQVGKKINEEKGTVLPEYKILGYTKTRKDGILMILQTMSSSMKYMRKHVMNFLLVNLDQLIWHTKLRLKPAKNYTIKCLRTSR